MFDSSTPQDGKPSQIIPTLNRDGRESQSEIPRIARPGIPPGTVVYRSPDALTAVWNYWVRRWRVQTFDDRLAKRLRRLTRVTVSGVIEDTRLGQVVGWLFDMDTRKLDSATVRRLLTRSEREREDGEPEVSQ